MANEESDEVKETETEKSFSTATISKLMDAYQAALDMTFNIDPNVERSQNVIREVKNAIIPYAELLKKRRQTDRQTKIVDFFHPPPQMDSS